ncbi:MAG: phage protease [Angelakisella sp.]
MKNRQLIIACSQKLDGVPEVIRLLPFGKVTSTKGTFNVDTESYGLMCKAMSEHGVDIVIDYEHQTLSGGIAPAAGWIKELILTDTGIDARVEWTDKAAGYLKDSQYRYSSPVILARNSDRKAVKLLSLALTNTPAIDGMFPIINSEFYDDEGEMEPMDEFLKKLIEMLGLSEGATTDNVLEAVTALLQKCSDQGALVVNKMLAPLLGVEPNADLPTVSAKIMALTTRSGYVSKEDYDAVKGKLDKLECEGMIEMALKDGKISPAQKEWAKMYALSDRVGFAKFLEHAVAVPMGEAPLATDPGKAVSAATMMVCKQMGVTEEDVKLYGGK